MYHVNLLTLRRSRKSNRRSVSCQTLALHLKINFGKWKPSSWVALQEQQTHWRLLLNYHSATGHNNSVNAGLQAVCRSPAPLRAKSGGCLPYCNPVQLHRNGENRGEGRPTSASSYWARYWIYSPTLGTAQLPLCLFLITGNAHLIQGREVRTQHAKTMNKSFRWQHCL